MRPQTGQGRPGFCTLSAGQRFQGFKVSNSFASIPRGLQASERKYKTKQKSNHSADEIPDNLMQLLTRQTSERKNDISTQNETTYFQQLRV
jgi:hypothetical protein